MKPIRKLLLRAWIRLARPVSRRFARPARVAGEAPLRAQLLSTEQLERHGDALARSHRVSTTAGPAHLIERLSDNQRILDEARDLLTQATQANRWLTPAGEWLLDNNYLIEEQVAIARRHLPKGYSRELPRLAGVPSDGVPRVYDIALNAISHGDGRIAAESLSRFVAAYHAVTPLTLGELCAIPIMLRLAL